jgi:hypothetical protein
VVRQSRCLPLETLDDGCADAAALDAAKQLDVGEFDPLTTAHPQPADRLAVKLDDAGRAAGHRAVDLVSGPLVEALAPSWFVEGVGQPMLSVGELTREEPDRRPPGSARTHPYGAVEPDRFAVEHGVLDDVRGEGGVFAGLAETGGVRDLIA